MNLLNLIFPTIATLLIFALSLGLGRLGLRRWRWRFDSPFEFHCLAGGIGMGILAHAVVILGLVGGWQASGFIPAGLILVAAAITGFRPCRRAVPPRAQPRTRPTPVEVIALTVLAVIVVCQGLRATLPSANYDVLEYHLGAVQHWLRQGRIFAFPHLFYASLPFEVEMWYALGCYLEGNPLLPATPKLINFGLLLCNLATLYVLVGALCRRRGLRLLACLLFAIHPLTAIVSLDALNDLGLTWYALLACVAWLKWLSRREGVFFVLWAIFLGLTVCCKYTAVGLIVFPALVCLLPVSLLMVRPSATALPDEHMELRWQGWQTIGRLAGQWALIGAIIAAVFSPWALKNALHHGNPAYPLLSSVFPSPTWSPEQTHFYVAAHGRTDPTHAAYWRALARDVRRVGPWLLAAVVAGLFFRRGRTSAIALTAAVAVGIAVHSFFPGNPARFMLPFLPIAAALAARLVEQVHRPGTPLRAAVIAPFVMWIALGVIAAVDPATLNPRTVAPAKASTPAEAFARIGFRVFAEGTPAHTLLANLLSRTSRLDILAQALGLDVVSSQRFINEQTPPGSRILLLYEARIGCFDRPVGVASVFDRSPLLEHATGAHTGDELRERLRDAGYDYLYVNEFELARLIRTYAPRPLYHERAARWGEPDNRKIDTIGAWIDLYPPYYQDPRFLRSRRVVEQFIESCRRKAVYTLRPGFPYGLWIAPIADDQPINGQ